MSVPWRDVARALESFGAYNPADWAGLTEGGESPDDEISPG